MVVDRREMLGALVSAGMAGSLARPQNATPATLDGMGAVSNLEILFRGLCLIDDESRMPEIGTNVKAPSLTVRLLESKHHTPRLVADMRAIKVDGLTPEVFVDPSGVEYGVWDLSGLDILVGPDAGTAPVYFSRSASEPGGGNWDDLFWIPSLPALTGSNKPNKKHSSISANVEVKEGRLHVLPPHNTVKGNWCWKFSPTDVSPGYVIQKVADQFMYRSAKRASDVSWKVTDKVEIKCLADNVRIFVSSLPRHPHGADFGHFPLLYDIFDELRKKPGVNPVDCAEGTAVVEGIAVGTSYCPPGKRP